MGFLIKGGRKMNREILFRGKRIDNREWVYGDVTQVLGSLLIVIPPEITEQETKDFESYKINGDISLAGFVSNFRSLIDRFSSYEIIPETVGQFVGKTDDFGTKVFEGDLLTCDEYDGILIAEFIDGSFMYWCQDINDYIPVGNHYENLKVVGNIHDKGDNE
jgi:hypothetical protein